MAAAAFENGRWGNWTMGFNMTQYVPSAKDLALAGPRMLRKLGHFVPVPDAVGNIFGGDIAMGQRIIPEATNTGIVDAATTLAAAAGNTRDFVQGGADILVDVDQQVGGLTSRFSVESVRSIGSVFSYATSKWALCCIVMAVILNRTQVYGSTRRGIQPSWKIRFLVRIVPIVMLAFHARSMLQSIQCQTSPDFSMLRWGNASKHSDLMFTQNGGFLHTLSSTLLLGPSDEESCLAVNMIAPALTEEEAASAPVVADLTGSLTLLWPLLKTFSFSQFIETLSCAVQGRPVAAETGMTLFEHSLAFAEADAAIGLQLGWGSFGTKMARAKNGTVNGTQIAITRAMIMKRVNTTPEVLLVGLLSAMNHLTSHLLALFNLQGKLRLLNTGFWGLAFMSMIVWSISTFSIDDFPNQSLLRFPTVCIVGFIPHVIVLLGILACGAIYSVAIVLTALAPPIERPRGAEQNDADMHHNTFMRRLLAAHHNMQANVPLGNIRISMHMDFYTALLRTGFSIMTMASEAVYLNESRGVNVGKMTWLEEDRLRELDDAGASWLGPAFRGPDHNAVFGDGMADNVGLVPVKDQPTGALRQSTSGYAREMTAHKVNKAKGHNDRAVRDGVGAAERSGRFIMAIEFFLGINRLLLSWSASVTLRLLDRTGFQTRPRWLLWLVQRPKSGPLRKKEAEVSPADTLNFWILSREGELVLPTDEHVDVEAEMRRRLRSDGAHWDDTEEAKLEDHLYGWWLSGGWWGGDDASGDFVPRQEEVEEDLTSTISLASTTSENEWESDGENDDGRRTPTQRSPHFIKEVSPSLDMPLNTADLAQLLHPKTPDQRAQSHALSAHFIHDGILTRSAYRDITARERSQVLTSTRSRPANFVASSTDGKLTPDEEVRILEELIMSRRARQAQSQQKSWAEGASGMGEAGPQCVVCQSSPRSVIVWPCRCLSLCDDCRVTLAMNNFDKCVCCRRDVASFSRIFVP